MNLSCLSETVTPTMLNYKPPQIISVNEKLGINQNLTFFPVILLTAKQKSSLRAN